ncbi:MAG: class I SAM-dependent methyltransferase [Solidesulfovibrio sp.]
MTGHKSVNGHHGPILHEKDGYQIIDCATCGFAHVVPLPTAEELSVVYREEYYTKEKPQCLTHQTEDRPWLDLVNGERAALLRRHLGDGNKTVLDAGCGGGFFLEACRKAGFGTLGVEPSRQAARHARETLGLTVLEGFLNETLAATLAPVDAIHAAEVLEHLPDPAGMLAIFHRLLKPDGLLFISLPNDENPLQTAARQTLGLPAWWIAPPHHLNYFTTQSIVALITRAGFTPLSVQGSFPMEFFLLMGENYVGDGPLGRACHAKRKAFETAMAAAGLSELKTKLYEQLAALGLGRTTQILARRNEPTGNTEGCSP